MGGKRWVTPPCHPSDAHRAFLDEKVFYEGSGSNAETAVSVVLGVVTL